MSDRDETLRKIYFDPAGFQSLARLFKEAKQKDKSITMAFVKQWYEKNVEKTKYTGGTNSFVAPHAKYEYQLDLFFINDLENQKYKIGLICIDIFSKFMTVVPLPSKQEADVAAGVLECLNNMRGSPKMIYTDDEGSFSSKSMKDILAKKRITHVVSRNHAPVAERAIRTFKDMMYKRIDNDLKNGKKGIQWTEYVYPVLLTYNNKNEHNSTKETPAEAEKPEKRIDVKAELEARAKRNRRYPELAPGDMVKIYTKRTKAIKERVPLYSERRYPVESIETKHGLKFYRVNGRDFMRNELLKV
jgi:hypothetical protein